MKRIVSLLLLISLLVCSLSVSAFADDVASLEVDVLGVNVYGEIELNISSGDFRDAGYEVGDLATVTILDNSYDLVISDQYPFVPYGDLFIWVGDDSKHVFLVGRMRMFLDATQIGHRVQDVDGSINWDYPNELDESSIHIQLNKKHFDSVIADASKLSRTYQREDYESDQVYANFRMISCGNIKPGVLYRSCSPIDNYLRRSRFADALCADVGINTFLNLCDSDALLNKYLSVNANSSPYYVSKAENILNNRYYEDFYEPLEMRILGKQLSEMANSDPPYLIHCVEGKDRTGFVAMLLESLMGATEEEMAEDYVMSFVNYYRIDIDGITAQEISNRTTLPCIRYMSEVIGELDERDTERIAYCYIKKCGVDEETIELLTKKLSSRTD